MRPHESVVPYEVVGMFADRPSAGSPLGVVPDAGRLSTAAMRAIATESGATETAFVLPPTGPDATYRVRVFAGNRESPHGGHSCVGTAATLVRLGRVPPGPVTQECGTGRQLLTAAADRATLLGAGPRARPEPDTAPLLAAAGLGADALDPGAAAGRAGYGAEFPFLPVRPEAVAAARPRYDLMAASGLPTLCLVSWDAALRTARARLFAPGFGIPEDPACGPVALALGVWLAGAGLLPGGGGTDGGRPVDGEHGYTVRQGDEAGRPARLEGTVTVADGRVVRGSVSGAVTPAVPGRVAVLPDPAA